MGTALAESLSSISALENQLPVVLCLLELLDGVPASAGRGRIAACVDRPLAVAAINLLSASPTSSAGPVLLAALFKQDFVRGEHALGPVRQRLSVQPSS